MLRFLISGLLFVLPASASAQAGKTPFCLPDEPFAPNDVIVRMGTEYYRTCRKWSTDLPWRQFLLRMNPALVPGLFSQFPPTSLTITEEIEGIDRLANDLRLKKMAGMRSISDVDYVEYVSPPTDANGKHNLITYVFDARPDDLIPSHWVSCVGAAFVDEGRSMSCFLRVAKGDVAGMLHFIGSKERGFGFMDHFPEFAQDIVRVLDVANVTDELEDYQQFLDVVE